MNDNNNKTDRNKIIIIALWGLYFAAFICAVVLYRKYDLTIDCYNYGVEDYKAGDYEYAEGMFRAALVCDSTKRMECKIRINYALSIVKQITPESVTSDNYDESIERLKEARGILTANGCAHDNDTNGHSRTAEKLKNEIDDYIETLNAEERDRRAKEEEEWERKQNQKKEKDTGDAEDSDDSENADGSDGDDSDDSGDSSDGGDSDGSDDETDESDDGTGDSDDGTGDDIGLHNAVIAGEVTVSDSADEGAGVDEAGISAEELEAVQLENEIRLKLRGATDEGMMERSKDLFQYDADLFNYDTWDFSDDCW